MNAAEASKLLEEFLIKEGLKSQRAKEIAENFRKERSGEDVRFSKPWIVWKTEQLMAMEKIP